MLVHADLDDVDFTTALSSLTMMEIEQALPWCTFCSVEK